MPLAPPLPTVDITTILAVVNSALATLFPSVPVLVKAADATSDLKAPQPGWTDGSALPCFVVSEPKAEPYDTAATFETITVSYPVSVEYCKSAAPQNWADDPEVRSMRLKLLTTFYQLAREGVPRNVFDIRPKETLPYKPNGAANVVASGVVIMYTLWLPRPTLNPYIIAG
jgi:hypothetical protein